MINSGREWDWMDKKDREEMDIKTTSKSKILMAAKLSGCMILKISLQKKRLSILNTSYGMTN